LILTDHETKDVIVGHLSELVGSWEGSWLSFSQDCGHEGRRCEDVEKHDDYADRKL
jgi:hypothetical protein